MIFSQRSISVCCTAAGLDHGSGHVVYEACGMCTPHSFEVSSAQPLFGRLLCDSALNLGPACLVPIGAKVPKAVLSTRKQCLDSQRLAASYTAGQLKSSRSVHIDTSLSRVLDCTQNFGRKAKSRASTAKSSLREMKGAYYRANYNHPGGQMN